MANRYPLKVSMWRASLSYCEHGGVENVPRRISGKHKFGVDDGCSLCSEKVQEDKRRGSRKSYDGDGRAKRLKAHAFGAREDGFDLGEDRPGTRVRPFHIGIPILGFFSVALRRSMGNLLRDTGRHSSGTIAHRVWREPGLDWAGLHSAGLYRGGRAHVEIQLGEIGIETADTDSRG